MSTRNWIFFAIAATSALLTETAVLSQTPTPATAAPSKPGSALPSPPQQTAANAATEGALVKQYCIGCHNDRAKTGGLSLENADVSRVGEKPELWEKVVRKLRAGVMPPPSRGPEVASFAEMTLIALAAAAGGVAGLPCGVSAGVALAAGVAALPLPLGSPGTPFPAPLPLALPPRRGLPGPGGGGFCALSSRFIAAYNEPSCCFS